MSDEINALFEDDYGICPKCKTEKLEAIWAHEEHAPGMVENWIAGLKCTKCGFIDFGELKIEEVKDFEDCFFNNEGICRLVGIGNLKCLDHGCEYKMDSNNPTYPKKESESK